MMSPIILILCVTSCQVLSKPAYNNVQETPLVFSDIGLVREQVRPVYEVDQFWYLTINSVVKCPSENDYIKMRKYFNTIISASATLIHTVKETINRNNLNNIHSTNVTSPSALVQMIDNVDSLQVHLDSAGRSIMSRYHQLATQGVTLWGLIDQGICGGTLSGQGVNASDAPNPSKRSKRNTYNQFHAGSYATFHHVNSRSRIHRTESDEDDIKDQTYTRPHHKSYRQTLREEKDVFDNLMRGQSYTTSTSTTTEVPHKQEDQSGFKPIMINKPPLPGFLSDQADQQNKMPRMEIRQCLIWPSGQESCSVVHSQEMPELLPYSRMFSQYIPRRSKRAVLSFYGKFLHWFGGVATDEQVENLQEQVKLMYEHQKEADTYLGQISDTLIATTRVIDEKFVNLSRGVERHFKSVDQQLNRLLYMQAQMQQGLDQTNEELHLVMQLQDIATIHSIILTHMLSIDQMTTSTFERFEDYRTMIQTQVLNPRIIAPGQISSALARLQESRHSYLESTRIDNVNELYTKDLASINIVSGYVVVTMRIPFLKEDQDHKTYKFTTLPLFTNGVVLRSALNNLVVLHNARSMKYTTMDITDYTECYNNPREVCQQRKVWRIMDNKDCITQLLNDHNSRADNCRLTVYENKNNFTFFAVPLWPKSWVFSVGPGLRTAERVCYKDSQPSFTDSFDILPINIATIEKGCKLVVGNHEITQPYAEEFKSTLSLDNKDNVTNFTELLNQHVHINRLHWDHILLRNESRITTANISHRLAAEDMFLHDEVTISEFTKKLREDGRVYKSKSEITNIEIKKLQHQFEQMSQNSTFWDGLFSWNISVGVGSLSMIFSVVALFLSVYNLWNRRNPVAAYMAASAMKPNTGYAAPTPTLNISEEYEKFRNLSNLFINTMSTGLNHSFSNNTIRFEKSVNLYQLTLQVMVMTILMLLCAWHLHKSLIHVFERYNSKHGFFPVNRHTVMNLGENKIVAFFLIEFSGACASKRHIAEVGIVLSTIFGNPKDWMLREPVNVTKWIKPCLNSRFSGSVLVNLNWSTDSFCILSKVDPRIETCHDMPDKVEVPLSEILAQVHGNLPWFWTSIRIFNCTRLEIEWQHRYYNLYNFAQNI